MGWCSWIRHLGAAKQPSGDVCDGGADRGRCLASWPGMHSDSAFHTTSTSMKGLGQELFLISFYYEPTTVRIARQKTGNRTYKHPQQTRKGKTEVWVQHKTTAQGGLFS